MSEEVKVGRESTEETKVEVKVEEKATEAVKVSAEKEPTMDEKLNPEIPVKDEKKEESFMVRTWNSVKELPNKALAFLKGIGNSIREKFSGVVEKVKNFASGLFSKDKLRDVMGTLRPIFALISIATALYLGAAYLLTIFTVGEILVGSAAATAVTYGVTKLTNKEKSEVSLSEMFKITA